MSKRKNARTADQVHTWATERLVADEESLVSLNDAAADFTLWLELNEATTTATPAGLRNALSKHCFGPVWRHKRGGQWVSDYRGWRLLTPQVVEELQDVEGVEEVEAKQTPAAALSDEPPRGPKGAVWAAVRLRRAWVQGHLGCVRLGDLRAEDRELGAKLRLSPSALKDALFLVKHDLARVLEADATERRHTAWLDAVNLADVERELARLRKAENAPEVLQPA
ncbi:hypothetical protein [Rhodococcus sp. JS3073]|uniref:hypothetical protein n=1 Tax=Rhodococcus sp. JS3073 TaxID=3002901 RepID=UPI0022860FCC|nr:hypothetical protein [Rhodococcus sp. JS3073]WAM17513.1 hypothetical protein OYT95_13110 [Rhodococcus sp. JS3073]